MLHIRRRAVILEIVAGACRPSKTCIGRVDFVGPGRDKFVFNVKGNRSALAPAASSPREAATSAASSAPAAPATPAAAATSAPSAATAGACYLYAIPRSSAVFLVEDIKCRQADVGDFLFTESDLVTRGEIRCGWLILRWRDRRGRTSCQGER
jgi:hypothetical protein